MTSQVYETGLWRFLVNIWFAGMTTLMGHVISADRVWVWDTICSAGLECYLGPA